jgi:hypothetical protein
MIIILMIIVILMINIINERHQHPPRHDTANASSERPRGGEALFLREEERLISLTHLSLGSQLLEEEADEELSKTIYIELSGRGAGAWCLSVVANELDIIA